MARSRKSPAVAAAARTYKILAKKLPITKAIASSLRKVPKSKRRSFAYKVSKRVISHMKKHKVLSRSITAQGKADGLIKKSKRSHKRRSH
jgi:hypothetical protein